MYKNVGKQIQKFSKVVCICEIVLGAILALASLIQMSRISVGVALFFFLLTCGLVFLFAWASNLRFYAYGVIAEQVEEQAQLLRYMAKGADTGLEKECPICGASVYAGDEFCSHCGTKINAAQ